MPIIWRFCAHLRFVLRPQTHLTQELVKNNENAVLITIQNYITAQIIWSCFKCRSPNSFSDCCFYQSLLGKLIFMKSQIWHQTPTPSTVDFFFPGHVETRGSMKLHPVNTYRGFCLIHLHLYTDSERYRIKREQSHYNQQNYLYCYIFAL